MKKLMQLAVAMLLFFSCCCYAQEKIHSDSTKFEKPRDKKADLVGELRCYRKKTKDGIKGWVVITDKEIIPFNFEPTDKEAPRIWPPPINSAFKLKVSGQLEYLPLESGKNHYQLSSYEQLEWIGKGRLDEEWLEAFNQLVKIASSYSSCDVIRAYVAWGKSFLKEGKDDEEKAFLRAIEVYIDYLANVYINGKDLSKAKLECLLSQQVEEAFGLCKREEQRKYLIDINARIKMINEKPDNFWRIRENRELFLKFINEDIRLNFAVTAYEEVDAFWALGKEFLALGKRKEAKIAFLTSLYCRIYSDRQDSAHFSGNKLWLTDIIKTYILYGEGEQDKDLNEIKNFYERLYGDYWVAPVALW